MKRKSYFPWREESSQTILFSSIGWLYLCMVTGCVGVQHNDPRLLNGIPGGSANRLSATDDLPYSTVPTHNPTLPPQDYEIGPQDLIEINLFNINQNDGLPNKIQVRVSNQGLITLPLVGQVKAVGLTRAQLEESLRNSYGHFMHHPDVGVSVAENRSQSVYVLGAVRNPGVFPLSGQESLRRLLSMAGGLTKEAGMYVHVSRRASDGEQAHVISLRDLVKDKNGEFDISIRPGDFVNVPIAGTFYVDGYVQKPDAYPLLQPYTLSQALVIAGGLDPDGNTNDITVFRRGDAGELKSMAYDLAKIRSKEQDDLKIEENDLIVVPPNTAKIVLTALLGMVGYTGRSTSYSWSIGKAGGRGFGVR